MGRTRVQKGTVFSKIHTGRRQQKDTGQGPKRWFQRRGLQPTRQWHDWADRTRKDSSPSWLVGSRIWFGGLEGTRRVSGQNVEWSDTNSTNRFDEETLPFERWELP